MQEGLPTFYALRIASWFSFPDVAKAYPVFELLSDKSSCCSPRSIDSTIVWALSHGILRVQSELYFLGANLCRH